MAVPQFDTANCTIILTLCLWAWTRLSLPESCHSHESILRQQNTHVFWAFTALLLIEIVSSFVTQDSTHIIGNLASGFVFFVFALASHRKYNGFWAKKRNLLIGLVLILTLSAAAGLLVRVPNFVSILSAIAISHLCRRQFVRIVVESVKDVEALQAKLLKQEAAFDNIRNFDNIKIKKTS